MIVVDTSVFVAILAREPEARRLGDALSAASSRVMSAGNYLEGALLADGRFGGRQDLDSWIEARDIEIRPVDLSLARLAADAFARFGRGRHPAGLDYGDCFAYALARSLRAPLLYKGGDFGLTDIEPALPA